MAERGTLRLTAAASLQTGTPPLYAPQLHAS